MSKKGPLAKYPYIRMLEYEGMKGTCTYDDDKYHIGYKIASKVKSELRRWLINECNKTAKESRKLFKEKVIIEWDNPYIIKW